MNSDCRAKTVFRTGRKSRMTCSFLALKRAEQYETMCTRLSCRSGPSSLTTFCKYLLSALQKFLGGSSILESSFRSEAVVFSLPFAHSFHEAASDGCVLRELEDDGDLML